MSLKDYLQDSLKSNLKRLEFAKSRIENSLDYLDETDLENELYIINLRSLWENEGGKSTHTVYKGALSDAITEAEEKFKRENNCEKVQAEYFVQISLGQNMYQVPEDFWKK